MGVRATNSKGKCRLAGLSISLDDWHRTWASEGEFFLKTIFTQHFQRPSDTVGSRMHSRPMSQEEGYLVFYEQMALVMSYQHCQSGTPVVDKGAADHTHRVLRREHAGGCCVFSGDLGGKLCKTERLIPTTENERNRNILSGTPHLPLGLWFSKSKQEKNSQKNKNTTAKWTFEGQHAHLRVRF